MLGFALLLIPVSAPAQDPAAAPVEAPGFARERERIANLRVATIASESQAPRRSGLSPDVLSLRFNFSLGDEPRSPSAEPGLLRTVDLTGASDLAVAGPTTRAPGFSHVRLGVDAGGGRSSPVAGARTAFLPRSAAPLDAGPGSSLASPDFLPAGDLSFALQRPDVPLALAAPERAFAIEQPPSSIPEPSTTALLGAGSLLLMWRAFRRRAAS